MTISINNDDNELEVRHITIKNGECEFKISVNNFNEIEIQKENFGNNSGDLIIKPSVSNVVRIS